MFNNMVSIYHHVRDTENTFQFVEATETRNPIHVQEATRHEDFRHLLDLF